MPLLPYCLHQVAAQNKPSISKAACKQIIGRFFVHITDATLYTSLLQAAYVTVSDELQLACQFAIAHQTQQIGGHVSGGNGCDFTLVVSRGHFHHIRTNDVQIFQFA